MEDQYEKMLKENAKVRLSEAVKAVEREEYDITAIILTEAARWFEMLQQYRVRKYN